MWRRRRDRLITHGAICLRSTDGELSSKLDKDSIIRYAVVARRERLRRDPTAFASVDAQAPQAQWRAEVFAGEPVVRVLAGRQEVLALAAAALRLIQGEEGGRQRWRMLRKEGHPVLDARIHFDNADIEELNFSARDRPTDSDAGTAGVVAASASWVGVQNASVEN